MIAAAIVQPATDTDNAMSPELYAAYLVACLVIIMVPGPTVTLIIANGIRHGARAGLANVAGTQLGIALMIAVVGVGLTSLIEGMGHWFEWLRLVGAAYLIWLGIQMFRSKGRLDANGAPTRPRGGFFLQGFLVAVSNPKTLVFFGAFFPQFIDPAGNHGLQIAVMGLTALVFAAASDSSYALLAGRAGRLLSARRVRLLNRVSGSFLVGGGLWLAFSRAK
jgi:threonine/homoserine/homoserine lactone efflux protein